MPTDSTTVIKFVCAFFAASILSLLPTPAQQPPASASKPDLVPSSQQIHLDVVVDTRDGQLVPNLRQQDFTVLDNKSPRPITSFKVVTAKQEPVEVIVVVDAVNTSYEVLSYTRDQTEKFLKANEGTLANPTTIAVLTDKGIQVTSGFSTDGNSLSDTLQHNVIGLREITRDSQWGGNDRLAICLKDLHQLVDYASTLPGRKLMLYISPGWPLLSGPGFNLDSRQQQQIFDSVVSLSTQLRQSKITLYDVNPIGASESVMTADYYQDFLKGLTKLSDAQYANLSLQVLAVQSGGLVFEGNTDVAGLIQKSLADAQSWYQFSFDPLPADKPNEYHRIDVRVDQPGLVVRTRTGYYSNPTAVIPGP